MPQGSRCALSLLMCSALYLLAPCRGTAAEPEDAPAEVPRLTVLLATSDEEGKFGAASSRILVREIVRQAILVAARDELGLFTRDMALRETITPGLPNTICLYPVLTGQEAHAVKLAIKPSDAADAESIFEHDISLQVEPDAPFDYLAWAALSDKLSHEEFLNVVKKAGGAGTGLQFDRSVQVSDDIRARLGEMNIFSQFAAIRALHSLERASGESPETLGALVRAYANLGELMAHDWVATPKSFVARSLVYAERLVRLDNGSPFALRHRAYAAGIAGLHAAALGDLEAARKAIPAEQLDAANAATPWEPLIDKLCHFDFPGLQSAPPPDDLRELGAFIAFLIVADSNSENVILVTGRDVLSISPENYRVCDGMARKAGVNARHMTSTLPSVALLRSLRPRLQGMPGLPKPVVELTNQRLELSREIDPAVVDGPSRAAIIDALVAAGAPSQDSGEPSWEALGRLVEDLTFMNIYWRLKFFEVDLGLPYASVAVQQKLAADALAHSIYLPAIQTLFVDGRGDAKKLAEICAPLKLPDAHWATTFFSGRIGGTPQGKAMQAALLRHADDVEWELGRLALVQRNPQYAQRALRVSPHSPRPIEYLLIFDPQNSVPHLGEWEAKYAQHADVVRAVASTYLQLNRLDDAERCLKQFIELSPDFTGYLLLAEVYRKQNNTEKWRDTLIQSLQQEDFGLSHAQVCVRLARYYLDRKELDEAVKYADMAAGSGAEWALMCATACHEARGDWEEAEQLVQARSMRYSRNLDWYYWCRRNGHGNVDAAKAVAETYIEQLKASKSEKYRNQALVFYLIADDRQAAFDLLKPVLPADSIRLGEIDALHLALLADEFGAHAIHDLALKCVIEMENKEHRNDPEYFKRMTALSKWILKCDQLPADTPLTLEELEPWCKKIPPTERADFNYFVGMFLISRKEVAAARHYFEQAVEADSTSPSYVLAKCELRKLPPAAEKPAAKAKLEDKQPTADEP